MRRFRRWFNMRFRTRKSWHPYGQPQLSRPDWWGEGATFSAAADSYEEARRGLDEWMDEVAAREA